MNMSQLLHSPLPGLRGAPSGRPSWYTLAVLCAVVAMGHGYLLQPDRTRPVPLQVSALNTRVIELGANLAAVPDRAPVVKQASAALKRPTAPAAGTPTPTPTPEPLPLPMAAISPMTPMTPTEPVTVATAPPVPAPVVTASPVTAPAPLPTATPAIQPVSEPVPMPVPLPLPVAAAVAVAAPLPVPVPVPLPLPLPVPQQLASIAQPPPAPEPPVSSRPPRESALTPGAVAVPPPARLLYRVESNNFPFRMSGELVWRQDGLGYDARLTMSAFGQSRVQTSRGALGAQGLLPLRFSDKYRSEVAAHFERDKGQISFSANTPTVPLLTGAQDYLSVMLQLATVIGGEPARYPVATAITVQVAGPRDAEVWLFTVEREETLRLPGGERGTLKLVRHPRRQFDQEVAIWLAPAMNWLPVRLRITEPNGDYLDQKWESTEAPS